jgi:hypothetical protein
MEPGQTYLNDCNTDFAAGNWRGLQANLVLLAGWVDAKNPIPTGPLVGDSSDISGRVGNLRGLWDRMQKAVA